MRGSGWYWTRSAWAGSASRYPYSGRPPRVAALLSGLGRHRGPDPDPDPGAGDLGLGGQAEREHGLLVVLSVPGGVKVRRREWRT